MIVEGLMTTENDDGTPNVSPMGPRVDDGWNRLLLRPFRTSTTYRNLKRTGRGVFHVTDDVETLARAAIGRLPSPPTCERRPDSGFILTDACRWYAAVVERLNDAEERTSIELRVVERGTSREFLGLNRAKHAVVEGAILATRLHLLPQDEVEEQLRRLRPLVEKTGGDAETRAFRLIEDFVRSTHGAPAPTSVDPEARDG